ncbi:MAG: cell division protein ZapA [Thiomargarita sp.]|nr:cell division protein ZapA [Thiomargarita sp.]
MSDQSIPINLHILDKDYVIACPKKEHDTLIASAEYLNQKIKEVRESGKIVSTERIVVVSALNIVHEYLQCKNQKDDKKYLIDDEVERLQKKLAGALADIKS